MVETGLAMTSPAMTNEEGRRVAPERHSAEPIEYDDMSLVARFAAHPMS
jgi:hypothetical protein